MTIIAVEEAFATAELFDAWGSVFTHRKGKDEAFEAIYKPLLHEDKFTKLRAALIDMEELRLADMDRHNVDVQVMSVTAPGVQVLDKDTARELTVHSNDALIKAINVHPNRFYGLIAIAPQDPAFSKKEIERCASHPNMIGIIVNSHTAGVYLDSEVHSPIFETAELLELPIYLHPNTPSPGMSKPYNIYGLEGPIWGFAAEAGLHAMRLMLSGTFDRYPRLQIILGHLGEGIPFWLSRIEGRIGLSELFDKTGSVAALKRTPRSYFRENFYFATSGMNESRALRYTCDVYDTSRILFAIDYPYESTQEAVSGINNSSLNESEKKKILATNAQNLFGITFSG